MENKQKKGNIDYEITWEDGEATVTLSTKTKYNIEVSRDNIEYSPLKTVSGLENGEYIYARLTNGEISGEEIKIDIIDSKKPEIQINVEETTTKEIRITAIATDEESGIKGKPYKYYISESTDGFKETADSQNETGSYTFKNLTQNTTFYIKVEIEDRAGNKQEKIITAKTELIPAAEEAIKREINWSADKTVQIGLTTETEFDILYSRNNTENWESYLENIEQTGTITANNGETIYIC